MHPPTNALPHSIPSELTEGDKREFLAHMAGVALASDAFFPFRDSIDVASRRGVKYISQAGGSVADKEVIEVGQTPLGFSALSPALDPLELPSLLSFFASLPFLFFSFSSCHYFSHICNRQACDEYNMVMAMSGLRLFHH